MKLCHHSPGLIHGVVLNNEDQEKLLNFVLISWQFHRLRLKLQIWETNGRSSGQKAAALIHLTNKHSTVKHKV
jgi:hypothetical protein